MIVLNYEDCTDHELMILYCKAACDLSYYNAAEGNDWYSETSLRTDAKNTFFKIREEFEKRNLEKPQGDWLI